MPCRSPALCYKPPIDITSFSAQKSKKKEKNLYKFALVYMTEKGFYRLLDCLV